MHALSESEVALVGKRCVHQLGSIALVLIGVGKLSIHQAQAAET